VLSLSKQLGIGTFPVPASAAPGPTFARFRFSSAGGLSYTGLAPDGEVEDYYVIIEEPLDFGDAPDPTYPTLSVSNGARHLISPNLFLGATVDAEFLVLSLSKQRASPIRPPWGTTTLVLSLSKQRQRARRRGLC
jgi:hypothetical protein